MEAIEPILAEERRAKRGVALRVKQVVASASTLSYTGIGGAFIEPVLKHQRLGFENWLAIVRGLSVLAGCVVAAPASEVDGGRV